MQTDNNYQNLNLFQTDIVWDAGQKTDGKSSSIAKKEDPKQKNIAKVIDLFLFHFILTFVFFNVLKEEESFGMLKNNNSLLKI